MILIRNQAEWTSLASPIGIRSLLHVTYAANLTLKYLLNIWVQKIHGTSRRPKYFKSCLPLEDPLLSTESYCSWWSLHHLMVQFCLKFQHHYQAQSERCICYKWLKTMRLPIRQRRICPVLACRLLHKCGSPFPPMNEQHTDLYLKWNIKTSPAEAVTGIFG